MNWRSFVWGLAGLAFVAWSLGVGSLGAAFMAGFMFRGAIDDFRLATRGMP